MQTLRFIRARSLWARTAGLLFRKKLDRDEALWIQPCCSIHTFGMRYPIAVYFLDKNQRVIQYIPELKPFRFSWNVKAVSVIEMVSTNKLNAEQIAVDIERLLDNPHSDLFISDSNTET